MDKEMTLEYANTLIDTMVDLEVTALLNDRHELLKLVHNEIAGRYESMSLEEVREMAEYYGIIEEAK
jgi:hypothetical protein